MNNNDLKTQQADTRSADPATDRFVIDRIEQLKAFANPLRQQLFEYFAKAPATTKQAADALGYRPTRLYHHVATLEKAGLVRLVSTRQVRGTTEKYYEAVASTLSIDPQMVNGENDEMSVLDGIFSNVRSDIASLIKNAADSDPDDIDEVMFAQLGVSASPDRIREIRRKLDQFIAEIQNEEAAREAHSGPEQTHRLVFGWYPQPEKPKNK
ncbi:MAG: helix-turn-helix domain-containing protein [Gammaproteobacteria bacterium]|nr:helix-turn-helix domain-containing protein [Gammaproteobacteria bacterium]